MAVTRLFSEALKGGHLAEILDVATRRALDAWTGAADETAAPALPGLGEDEGLAAAMELLRDVAPADPPESWDPRPYIEGQAWTFAKTMPERPHEYVVMRKSTDWREHLRFLRWLRVHGEPERFGGSIWPARTVGEWRYWAGADPNWTIINRRKAP